MSPSICSRLLSRRSRVSAVLLMVLGCSGQAGNLPSNPPPPVGAKAFDCPVIPETLGSCGDVHLLKAALACGGDGKMPIAHQSLTGGGLRINAQLQNGSHLRGMVLTPTAGCGGYGAIMGVTFGVVYTGEQGVEPDTNSTPCMIRSKMDYSQFQLDDPVTFGVWESNIKDKMHLAFDQAVMNYLFSGTGAFLPRCSRWKVLTP